MGDWREKQVIAPCACAPILIASHLKAAAARNILPNLHTVVDNMPSPAVLSALAKVSSLTKLELYCSVAVKHWYLIDDNFSPAEHRVMVDPASASKLACELSGLRQLRALHLRWADISTRNDVNPLWRGLSGLSQLTSLTTTYTLPEDDMGYLCYLGQDKSIEIDLQGQLTCKHTLAKLTVLPTDGYLFGSDRPLLRPLTSLQALTDLVAPAAVIEGDLHPYDEANSRGTCSADSHYDKARDKGGPVLPCSLRKLELSSVDDMGHLLRLTSLTLLALHVAAEVSAQQLLRLTALGSLAHLRLGYFASNWRMRRTAHPLLGDSTAYDDEEDTAVTVLKQHAAQAWAVLPLRHL
ncbi:hypothetical protein OEZ85_013052 [Tetradesmus obliquus]|uniref:Ig-like domain-containing protein n=1 Tax=Tetradesmus obliquus TaxID=3088 RepID=A0ABY8U5H5_TETOB|nr:hypothetical protein OEZ85_013052 [Tetradesmus obliquus]